MTTNQPLLMTPDLWMPETTVGLGSDAVEKALKPANDVAHPVLSTLKILIIGGGMGGLASALALSLRGFQDITLFESASELAEVGAGINITPNLARLLDSFGVLDFIKEDAIQLVNANIYSKYLILF